MPRGGKRANQTGRPKSASPAVYIATLFGPAHVRRDYQAADDATRQRARRAALTALLAALRAPEEDR